MKFVRKCMLIPVLLVWGGIANAQEHQPSARGKMHKVVMQLNTADTASWSSLIGNVKHLQEHWPGKVKIEVVVHGKALTFLVKGKTHLASEIMHLASATVQFMACENTMKKYGVTSDMLLDGINTVPSGVSEIILKQEKHWGYLKAGL